MPHSQPSPSLRRVLVVEDDESLSTVLDELLKLKDYQVTCASDGGSGYELARMTKPRVIVTDLTMPRGSGHELLDRLRQDAQLKDVPVIVISAHASASNQAECRRLGAAAFFAKPFRPEELLEAVKSCF